MLLEFGQDFVVYRHLITANGTPVRRIKSQNDRPSAQFTQADFLIRSDVECEVRRFRSWREDSGHFISPLSSFEFIDKDKYMT